MRLPEQSTLSTLSLSCSLGAIVLCVAFFPLAAGAEGMTLQAAVLHALKSNPDVVQAETEVEAARGHRVGAALLLQDNPEVGVAVGPRSRPQAAQEEDLDLEISATQSFEIAGQRAARIDATTAALAAAEARLAERRAVVAAEVREAFGRVLGAEARKALADAALGLAQQAVEAADERHRRGAASLIELNTARVEVGRSNRAKLEAERRRAAASAELKLLLAIDPGDSLSLDGELESLSPTRDLDVTELSAIAARSRPALIAARHDLESARAEERLARREAVPSPRIGARYQREEDTEIVQGTLSLDLPLFARNQAEKRVSRTRRLQAERLVAALERQVAQQVTLSVNSVQVARETLEGFAGDVLKALDENVALVNKGYEAGKIDFLQLILIRRETLEARRDYIEALEELNTAEAELDRAVGMTPFGP
jgi:cobalt-zinc-cadmium efflux system outer membrane protein